MRLLSGVFESSKYVRKYHFIYGLGRNNRGLWKKMCKFRLFQESVSAPTDHAGNLLQWFLGKAEGWIDLVA